MALSSARKNEARFRSAGMFGPPVDVSADAVPSPSYWPCLVETRSGRKIDVPLNTRVTAVHDPTDAAEAA